MKNPNPKLRKVTLNVEINTVQRILSARPNFCEALTSLPSSNICDITYYQIMRSHKLSREMECEVESEVECDQRIPHLQGCLGELATLEKCCNIVVHVIHTTI